MFSSINRPPGQQNSIDYKSLSCSLLLNWLAFSRIASKKEIASPLGTVMMMSKVTLLFFFDVSALVIWLLSIHWAESFWTRFSSFASLLLIGSVRSSDWNARNVFAIVSWDCGMFKVSFLFVVGWGRWYIVVMVRRSPRVHLNRLALSHFVLMASSVHARLTLNRISLESSWMKNVRQLSLLLYSGVSTAMSHLDLTRR